MIRVAVSKNQILELMRRMAKFANRPEDGRLLAWEPSVDECQSVIAFDQEGVCKPHRDDVHAVYHTLHSHLPVCRGSLDFFRQAVSLSCG